MGCDCCKIDNPKDWLRCQILKELHKGISPCGAVNFKEEPRGSNYTPPKKKKKRKK